MNWTVSNNGAFDYAADTRGYTIAAAAEYTDAAWTVRAAQALMPTTANGIHLDWDLRHAGGTNLEFEWRHGLVPGRRGTVRVLGFLNRARMGNYREALAAFLGGVDPVPDITAHRQPGSRKYGTGLNLEQDVADHVMLFARAGWNDGHTESFAFTEVDRAAMAGIRANGVRWRRPGDRAGIAISINGISASHREYLAAGGLGFLVGDGRLHYGREHIIETFYTAALVRGAFAAVDLQYVVNPGYNRDRGPIVVAGARLHVGF
jgi:carbohydrate-selective porin OprB